MDPWWVPVLQKAGYHKHAGMPWWHPMDRKHKAGDEEREPVSARGPAPAQEAPAAKQPFSVKVGKETYAPYRTVETSHGQYHGIQVKRDILLVRVHPGKEPEARWFDNKRSLDRLLDGIEGEGAQQEARASLSTPQAQAEAPQIQITDTSRKVFEQYARDAKNWSGTPLVGGNLGGSAEERGNLTQLKRAGLITTQVEENDVWITFTEAGKRYAAHLGIDLEGRQTPAKAEQRPSDQGRRWGAPGAMQKPWTLAGKPMPGAKE